MIKFGDFKIEGDLYYQVPTVFPLSVKGVTLCRGRNLDAAPASQAKEALDLFSNGAGKSRIPQMLEAFCFGSSEGDHYKKMFLPHFKGELSFQNTVTGHDWNFAFDMQEEKWTILRDGQQFLDFHKPSECQALLAKELGLVQKDWGHFIHISYKSIDTLLSGKPEEKRKYLESFFNIDEWYDQHKKEIAEQKIKLEEELNELLREQARLFQVLDTLAKNDGELFLERQIELATEGVVYLRKEEDKVKSRYSEVREQVNCWREYYDLCKETEDLEQLDELKQAKAELDSKLALLKEKQKQKIVVETKVRDLPSETVMPKEPEFAEPEEGELLVRQETLGRMREKLKVVERFKKVKTRLPQAPQKTEDEISFQTRTLLERKAEVNMHIDLLKDGNSCSKCGQSLDFILKNDDPEQKKEVLEEELRQIEEELKILKAELIQVREYQKLKAELSQLKEELSAFPVFGKSVEQVTGEIETLTARRRQWRTYRQLLETARAEQTRREVLLAEITALGYPDILNEDHSADIAKLRQHIEALDEKISSRSRLQILLDKVVNFKPLSELEPELSELVELQDKFAEALRDLSMTLGSYRANLLLVREQKAQKESLEEKLKELPRLQKEHKIIEAMAKFFSPSGFKMFELRKRCDSLIDRCNYWSQVFCQEVYEWSMPADLKKLDFLVQPVNFKKSVSPYPARRLSGGELNRASNALLFAHIELTPPSKSQDLMFLDEIERNLDKGGQISFTETVISKLKETFPEKAIIMISHDESLKNSFDIDHHWIVTRKDRKSSLETHFDYHRKAGA